MYEATKGIVKVVKELFFKEIEIVKIFCHLGDRLNPSVEGKAATTARIRIAWSKIRGCGEWLNGKKFLLKTKGRAYPMVKGQQCWAVARHCV